MLVWSTAWCGAVRRIQTVCLQVGKVISAVLAGNGHTSSITHLCWLGSDTVHHMSGTHSWLRGCVAAAAAAACVLAAYQQHIDNLPHAVLVNSHWVCCCRQGNHLMMICYSSATLQLHGVSLRIVVWSYICCPCFTHVTANVPRKVRS